MSDSAKGSIAAITYSIIIGLVFMFTKTAVMISTPIKVMFFRFFLSFLGIVILILFRLVNVSFKGKNIIPLLGMSFLFPSGFFLVQSYGLKTATSSEAGVVNALTPVIMLLLSSIFLKEKITIKKLIFLLISVTGVIYIFYMQGSLTKLNSLMGPFLIFLSVLLFCMYSILSRKYSKDYTPMEICAFMQGFGFIIFTILLFFTEGINIYDLKLVFSNNAFLGSILYISILATLCTALLNNYALSKIEAGKVGIFVNLATVVSIFAGAIFLSEPIDYYHFIGCFLIIGGIVGMNKIK